MVKMWLSGNLGGGQRLHVPCVRKKTRIDIIDYLKALAIIFVILTHSGLIDQEDPLWFLILSTCVPIFMILSGYVVGIKKDRKLFSQNMVKSFIRFFIPTLIAFSIWFMHQLVSNNSLTFFGVLKIFLLGTYGQGAYYFALMVQFIFIAPLIVKLIQKVNADGLIWIALLNFFWEIMSASYGVDAAIYRILIFRYLLLIGLGVYIGENPNTKIDKKILAVSIIFGVIYTILPVYWDYEYRIFTYKGWCGTSMMFSLYVFPLIYMILQYFKDYTSKSIIGRMIALIGQSSYHIMYTQMIYYNFRPGFDKWVLDIGRIGTIGELIINISVTVVSGIAFWYMDNRFLTGNIFRYL